MLTYAGVRLLPLLLSAGASLYADVCSRMLLLVCAHMLTYAAALRRCGTFTRLLASLQREHLQYADVC
jgi:hypothetical protein